MRLSKFQANAIARQIQESKKEPKAELTPLDIAKAEKAWEQLQKIDPDLRGYMNLNRTLSNVRNAVLALKTPKKKDTTRDFSAIERDVIIASISAKSVEEIIRKVKP